ncbi:MAG: tyrosinase family protein [Oligoflexales bacterium]
MDRFSTRRTFIKGSVAGFTGLILGCKSNGSAVQSETNSPVRLRKNIWKLTSESPDLIYFKSAILVMRQIGVDHPTLGNLGWAGQVKIHREACPHLNWYFFPWHRVYTSYFENIADMFAKQLRAHLRKEVPKEKSIFQQGVVVPKIDKELADQLINTETDFALPYWDWSFQDTGPDVWITMPPILMDDNILNPTLWKDYWPEPINRWATDESTMAEWGTKAMMNKILAIDSFAAFASAKAKEQKEETTGGEFEAQPHNNIHQWVGGAMSGMNSPLDPAFWLHHSNSDRIWESWMMHHHRDPKIIEPSTDAADWKNSQVWGFYDLQNKPAVHKIADTLTIDSLTFLEKKYTYDEYVIPPESDQKPAEGIRLVDTTSATITSDFVHATASKAANVVTLNITDSGEKTSFVNVLKAYKNRARKLVLTIRNIPTPRKGEDISQVKFYIEFEKGAPQWFYIATYAFFAPHHPTQNIMFEISTLMSEIEETMKRSQVELKDLGGLRFNLALFKSVQTKRRFEPISSLGQETLTAYDDLAFEVG